jgi:hypothetical protein
MRIFWRVIGGFFVGLIVTYLVVVLGMFAYASINDISDRDGGMSMGIIFGIGPAAAILGGLFCAITAPILLRRRDGARTSGELVHVRRWPLPLRITIAATVSAAVVYFVAWSMLWLRGPIAFDTYWMAYAVGNLPRVLALAAAAIAAWLVYRKEPQK